MTNQKQIQSNLLIVTLSTSKHNAAYDLVAIQNVFTGKIHWQGSRHQANKMMKYFIK
jgi:hypothetical protein